MAINYASSRALAARLIAENGTTGILTRRVVTAYDPLTDTETGGPQDIPITMVVLPVESGDTVRLDILSSAEGFNLSAIVKVLIPANNLPAGFVPAPGDYLTGTGGGLWTILANSPLQPDGSAIIHSCICQAGATRP